MGLSNVTRPRASSGSLTWVVLGAYAHPKSHFTCRGRGQMSAHHTPEEIRKDLTHPVIDGDGHWVEYTPVFAEKIRKVTGDLGANGFLQSQRRGPDSLSMTPEQRAERGVAMEGFWGRQSTNTRDRATAMMPRMLYDRLDELGIDFGIVYPTAGLGIPRIADDATRRAVIRGFNVVTHEYFKDLGDKLTPAAVIPVHTPDEAIEELTFVTKQLGARVCMFGSGAAPRAWRTWIRPSSIARCCASWSTSTATPISPPSSTSATAGRSKRTSSPVGCRPTTTSTAASPRSRTGSTSTPRRTTSAARPTTG